MTALWIVLAVLGVYRVARMIVSVGEDGPFSLLLLLREWATAHQGSWVGRGLLCYLCVSVWLSAGAALLVPLSTWNERGLAWGGIAGGAVFLWKWLKATGMEE